MVSSFCRAVLHSALCMCACSSCSSHPCCCAYVCVCVFVCLCVQVQLILPEALKLLPLYSLALHKSNMLRPDVRADDRSAWLAGILGASPQRVMGLLHPRCFAVHNLLVGKQQPDSDDLVC